VHAPVHFHPPESFNLYAALITPIVDVAIAGLSLR